MDNTNFYSKSFCGDYRVKHILIKPIITKDMDPSQIVQAKEEARQKAQDLIVKLTSGGNWSNLVKQYSDDKISALRDGLIKNFRRGGVDANLYETVVRLRDGRYTQYPVESKDGYHILLRVSATKDEEEETKEESQTDEEEQQDERSFSTEESSEDKKKSDESTSVEEKSKKEHKKQNSSYVSESYDYSQKYGYSTTKQERYTEDYISENTYETKTNYFTEKSINGQNYETIVNSTISGGQVEPPLPRSIDATINVTNNQSINATVSANVTQERASQPGNENSIGEVTVKGSITLGPKGNGEMEAVESVILSGQGETPKSTIVRNTTPRQVQGIGPKTFQTQNTDNPLIENSGIENFRIATAGETGVPSTMPNLSIPQESLDVGNLENGDFPRENLEDGINGNATFGQSPLGKNMAPLGGLLRPTLNNSKNSSKLQEKLQQSKGKDLFNNLLNRRNNGKDGEKKKDPVTKAQEEVASKALSTAAQSAGIPKPIADAISKKLAGPAVKAVKRKIMISVIASVLMILLPIIFIAVITGSSNENSENRNEYLYGSGDEQSLYAFLIEMGYCNDIETCSSTDAANFYKNLKSELDSHANLTEQEADIFMTTIIFYNRSESEAFTKIDELDALATILSSEGKFSIENYSKYEDYFVNDDGYFMTYRKDDLLQNNESMEYRKSLYVEIVNQAIKTLGSIDKYEKTTENKKTGYLVCSQITVTGNLAGTYDLEEYVAKVISNENDWAPNGNLENNKAQAVAARTFALRTTNNCTKSIENSTRKQTMRATASQNAIAATQAVAGQVLVDSSGDYYQTMYDAFCLSSSDNENYYIVQKNLAIPKTWAKDNKIPSTYLKHTCGTEGDGGHGYGMSQWGARYLASTGKTYDEILNFFYDDASIITLISGSSGLVSTDSGFLKRVSRATRDNEYFYGDNASNEGECAWYAVRRTNEILATLGSSKKVTSGGNGGDFCKSADYASFNKVYNVQDLKPGMVISWAGGTNHSYGHVAIIEDVYYDSNGNVTSIDVSEGSNSSGSGYNTVYNGNYINNSYIWSLSNGTYKQQIRQYNCEGSLDGSTGTGCQRFTNIPVNQIKNRWSSYKFICAIDLLER